MIVVISGPSGVGKTKLSIELAKKYNGIVVNADASQIFKHLDIGTSKIKPHEKSGIPHYLFDIKEVDEDYSVSDYQTDLRNVIDKNIDKNIFIVGGTGLYMCAGLTDYKFNKKKDIDLSNYTNDELYQMIKDINKDIEIDKRNRRRMENFILSGKDNIEKPKELYDAIYIGLTTDRKYLYNRINSRVDEMVKEGLIKEVEDLYKKYKNARILHSAIGYKELIKYFDNELTLDESLDLIKKNTRHYAKRQYTWFNNKMNVKWFNTDYNNFDNTIKEIENYLNK